MIIRQKITLVYMLFTASLLLAVFGFIYYFSFQYTEREFYMRLEERARIVAQSYLEKDELSAHIYDEIRKRHLQVLPREQETILQVNVAEEKIIDGPRVKFPDSFIDEVFEEKQARFQQNNTHFTGLMYTDNQGDFMVIVSAVDQYGRNKIGNLRNILIISFILSLIGIYVIGRYYAGKVLNPIIEITEKANAISASNLGLRLETGNNKDELSELASTFNRMLDRLETSFDIQTNFVNNASHELKNPLTAILGETEFALKRERKVEEYVESLRSVEKEAQRLSLMVNSLLALAKTGTENKGLTIEEIRMDELVWEIKHNIDQKYPDNRIVLNFNDLPDGAHLLVIRGNQSLLTVALGNILDNACKFSNNQEVAVKVTVEANGVIISIKDNGVGIPNEELKSITEPFYRASNARAFNGFGIGLPLAQRIIKMHKGTLEIFSDGRKGTEVNVSFPGLDTH